MRPVLATIVFLFGLLPLVGNAATSNTVDTSKPTLVVIVDVTCPYCKAFVSEGAGIRAAAERAGVNFLYAPIPGNGHAKTAWPARFFYASRALGENKSIDLLKTLFDSQDIHPVRTRSETLVWLQTKKPDRDWKAFYRNSVNTQDTLDAVKRALLLAATVHLTQFPTLIIVGDGDKSPYQLAATPHEKLPQRVKEVGQWLEQYKLQTLRQEDKS